LLELEPKSSKTVILHHILLYVTETVQRYMIVCCMVLLLAGHGDYDYQSGPGMAPVQSGPPGNIPLPDLSKPPPGFPPGPGPGFGQTGAPPQPPPLMSLPLKPPQDTDLMPSMPYYDLPAGLMAPLVKVWVTVDCIIRLMTHDPETMPIYWYCTGWPNKNRTFFEIPYFCSQYRYNHAVFNVVFKNYIWKQQRQFF